jgi:hypothetical protein
MTSMRRKFVGCAALVVLAVPTLSACNLSGFKYATDKPNTIANGGYHIEGDVHVLAARIVAPSDGTGKFIASISVDAHADAATLTSIEAEGLTFGEAEPITIEPHRMVNLFTDGAIPVTGDFKAGQSIPVELTFSTLDEPIKVNAIVVTECHEYASEDHTGSASETDEHATETAAPTETAEPYSCDYAEAPALSGGH